ncbi:ABC transporter permease/M1 family aminopeptidase [Labilibacter marinus]|uniref:ABC transporter permease/M1 family aminopeptidase n=1 Tax=Labilibacter marinus TaxID=1477105 RepID=UPI00083167CA|nr:M1 family aminopeptidase [Labilibacter marinus]
MFKIFLFSEIRYALRQPMVYIFFILFTLLVFGATVSDNIQIGGAVGNVYRNAPHVITIFTTVLTIFGLLMATAFFNNAALRDFNNGFNEILFSTPINKSGFFFGRFFGALFLATIPLLGVFLGVLMGSVLGPAFGWVDADRFGSFYLATFINNYCLFILPNMFIAGSIIFSLSAKWKNTVVAFVGALIIIIGYIVSGELMSDLESETIAAISDVFGIRTYSLYAKYFTPIEKNTLSPTFSGLLLINRIIWILVAVVILAISYLSFSFQEKNKRAKKDKKDKVEKSITFKLPEFQASFNSATNWVQFKSFFRINFFSITKSVTFKILFLFAAILLITDLVGGFEYFGLQAYPLTYKMIDLIAGSTIFILIILVFFSGELIWRDRESKINEVIDATSHATFISLSAKALSLISITTLIHFSFVIVGILYQLGNGFTRIEISLYILDFIYFNLPNYIVWSGIMVLIQTLVNNKYLGYFASILIIFIWSLIMLALDIQSNMLAIGGGPNVTYSDMNGFGPAEMGAHWFNAYWILIALICLLLAGALYNRGAGSSILNRIKHINQQLTKGYASAIWATLAVWLILAGFVFYNTQILNTYKTSDQSEDIQVEYEKTYKKYEKVPLPKIIDAKYFIDIYPYKRDVFVKANFKINNQTNQAIDSIHFNIDSKWQPEFDIPNATLVLEDKKLEYLIYKLDVPMRPGDTIDIEIKTKYITKGFKNNTGNTNIVNNGTFLNNFEILPSLGYNKSKELNDKNDRKKHGLKPKDRMPELQQECSCSCMANYLTDGSSDFLNVETIISTSPDQIAIAPGSLMKEWKENGRNYFHYKVDHPSQNFFSFTSATFEVAKRKWNDVDIEVYYDEKHKVNVDMMLDAVERSLAYYTKEFGPYYHNQCRIIEFPRYASFAQAFPGTMPYSESMGFIINLEDENDNNIIDAVIAHEIAHQWWAHQVIGAEMQGSTMMSESFAEYSSLMTMKSIAKTPMKMRDFIKYDHNRYLRGRGSETEKELPLYKVENQMYIHYGKGSVILYALQDYIGENKVNTAMRAFLEEYRYEKPPYPTSLDFLKYLEPQVPDSLTYLINDWFKEITLYDNRVKRANYSLQDNGKYLVSMDVESYKIKADTIGNETKVDMNDWIDIGVFADSDEEELMFQKRVKINQPQMTFTFEVDTIPAKAAIDPRMLLIDRVYDDNTKSLSLNE